MFKKFYLYYFFYITIHMAQIYLQWLFLLLMIILRKFGIDLFWL